jgi:hypothetical protein
MPVPVHFPQTRESFHLSSFQKLGPPPLQMTAPFLVGLPPLQMAIPVFSGETHNAGKFF